MANKLKGSLVFTFVVVMLIFTGASLIALNTPTHFLINVQSARISATFDSVLKSAIGFPDGRLTTLTAAGERLPVDQWIGKGGIDEDDGVRFLRHFHDPLQPWATAGLAGFDSSVRWMQRPAGGTWSWHDARQLYYLALTESDPARREALFVDTFRALGQVMHLVVDASVPEHTRNDPHPLGGSSRHGSYEYWASRLHANPQDEAAFINTYLALPISFNSQILQRPFPLNEPIAREPIARLIDADVYDGSNPEVTLSSTVGLSEVANANFFSEDTLTGEYPFPSETGLIQVNLTNPYGRVRRYFSRPEGQGLLPANPLRAECASERYGNSMTPPGPFPCVDGVVWNQVAAHMLPRAVGYAAGVLDHFFRGRLQVNRVFWQKGSNPGIFISVTNATDEDMNGTFEVYARHEPGTPTERQQRSAFVAGGLPVQLAARQTSTLRLTINGTIRASDAQRLVFRGRLGLENDAVIGQVFHIPNVLLVQEQYDSDLQTTCTPPHGQPLQDSHFSGFSTALWFIHSDQATCSSIPINQRFSGVIQTKAPRLPGDQVPQPIIAAISAVWRRGPFGGFAGVSLKIDGTAVSSAGWKRVAQEPDPTTFEVFAPEAYVFNTEIVVTVTLLSGQKVVTNLTGMREIRQSHGKRFYATWEPIPNSFNFQDFHLLISESSSIVHVAYNAEDQTLPVFYQPISISGTSFGTDTRRFHAFRSHSVEVDGTYTVEHPGPFGSFVDVRNQSLSEIGDRAPAKSAYNSIFLGAPHPSGPAPRPEAVIKRLYDPNELSFLKAFVQENIDDNVIAITSRMPGS